MPIVRSLVLLTTLKEMLSKLPLVETGGTDSLFDRVEIYANKKLGDALSELVITKQRVCLIVPLRIIRQRADSGGGRVLVKRFLEVDLLLSDRSYFRAAQRAVEGGDTNIGLLEMDERIELALEGFELSNWGEAILQESAAFELSAKDAPAREAWVQNLLIPAGDIRSETY